MPPDSDLEDCAQNSRALSARVTDVTYIATMQGWLYLVVMLDLFSRRVVGWAVSESNDTSLALLALERSSRRSQPR